MPVRKWFISSDFNHVTKVEDMTEFPHHVVLTLDEAPFHPRSVETTGKWTSFYDDENVTLAFSNLCDAVKVRLMN